MIDPITHADVTVIVLNWNGRDETLACLESLTRAELNGATVMVVDNGSRDGSVDAVRERFPQFEVLALPENRGFTGGNNAGIRVALERGAKAVLLLNNDLRVAPDFIQPLLWVFNAHPDAGAVSGAIHRLDVPEMLDVAYCEVQFARRDSVRLVGVNRVPGHGHGFNVREEVSVAVGCCLLLRAKTLRHIGLFDEAYFTYHEDVDWCMRAHRAYWRIFYEPFSRVYHRGSGSTKHLDQRPPPAAVVLRSSDDLPQAEPSPWNPVRTYLGARNLVRLLRSYATRWEKRQFLKSCAYEIPLQLLAIVLGREGWMTLGRWTYPEFVRAFFLERHATLRNPGNDLAGRLRRGAALLVLAPVDLFYVLPRAVLSARRRGRLDQFAAYLRGLWDGLLDRPLPLERLGLR